MYLTFLFVLASIANNKGRTWGPSTGNQKTRHVLPNLSKCSQPSTKISKSAPNLNKPINVLSRDGLILKSNAVLEKKVENNEKKITTLETSFNIASGFQCIQNQISIESQTSDFQKNSEPTLYAKNNTFYSKSNDDLSHYFLKTFNLPIEERPNISKFQKKTSLNHKKNLSSSDGLLYKNFPDFQFDSTTTKNSENMHEVHVNSLLKLDPSPFTPETKKLLSDKTEKKFLKIKVPLILKKIKLLRVGKNKILKN